MLVISCREATRKGRHGLRTAGISWVSGAKCTAWTRHGAAKPNAAVNNSIIASDIARPSALQSCASNVSPLSCVKRHVYHTKRRRPP
jgi:hypothetical protein